jgi:hypothetical protein
MKCVQNMKIGLYNEMQTKQHPQATLVTTESHLELQLQIFIFINSF